MRAALPVGSEPGVGWGFVKALAKYHDLWVLTEREKFKSEIEAVIQEDPLLRSRVSFHFIQKKRNRRLRKIWPPSYYWYYRKWQWDAFVLARQMHRDISFDLVHQLTMVGFREPGYLWQLDLPFVWGPVGGMGYFPSRFLPTVGIRGALYYLGYNCMNFLHSHYLRRPKKAAIRAGPALITATPENQSEFYRRFGCKSTVISEVGIPSAISGDIVERVENMPLKIVWTGAHVPGKALGLALTGVSMIDKKINWELHILGKGPETEVWKKDARQKEISTHCFFHGWLPRKDALETMKSCHVMLITSLRDLTSTVTIEGLSLGLPVICLDHCGFSHAITPECGIKIPVTSPDSVTRAIAENIKKLWLDERLRQKLARGAIKRSQAFSWEKKGAQVDEIYRKVISLK